MFISIPRGNREEAGKRASGGDGGGRRSWDPETTEEMNGGERFILEAIYL
jgi:hypothetical protein